MAARGGQLYVDRIWEKSVFLFKTVNSIIILPGRNLISDWFVHSDANVDVTFMCRNFWSASISEV